ncbi:flagellar motor switch protein FliN [Aliirhizobium smilacinae]|uniref:Flagellar motor switch protein FliN n=1 Tax=Aliirhizobium smilacinae TaxID=1395944 RepID=A0A5C4XTT8_9HYPH|nr:flagellar motor switch protein FliN [Rhizobium smilacinae]TNM66104.1 flagellar motor switch protein FliN [Rhizobium smilacinae]
MATKKTASTDENGLPPSDSDFDFDNAVNELRGVMKHDAEGTAPAADDSFGFDFPAGGETSPELPVFGDAAGSSDFGASDDFGASSDFGFSQSETKQSAGSGLNSNLDLIMDIPIDVHVVLGTSRISVSNLMNLQEGAVVALDKKIGEPVDITVNGRRIARGEITVLEDDDTRFGVKLIEVMSSRTS